MKVLTPTKEEREKFWKENKWVMHPNHFLVRVVKYVFKDNTQILTILNSYLKVATESPNETNFTIFKSYEEYLFNAVNTSCKNESEARKI